MVIESRFCTITRFYMKNSVLKGILLKARFYQGNLLYFRFWKVKVLVTRSDEPPCNPKACAPNTKPHCSQPYVSARSREFQIPLTL